jgi:hypothetical protein
MPIQSQPSNRLPSGSIFSVHALRNLTILAMIRLGNSPKHRSTGYAITSGANVLSKNHT